MSLDDIEMLKPLILFNIAAGNRIESAVKAGEICDLAAPGFKRRCTRVMELATRGQMSPREAALELIVAEQTAMATRPLQERDNALLPCVVPRMGLDVRFHAGESEGLGPVNSPPRPNPAFHMKEQGDEYDQAMGEELARGPDGPPEDDMPDDRHAA
ncbi:hypothetical protein [Methylobacterium nonmethylotrophicum]|uniref:Uncharacterized protein n=1 Tax=Methylobacterium nonmethylotrophicum TaxID=1141884 RepID=A0A4Z0NU32_9HYPH|nr:hypothetical protein [Methylobacterium nonmethylotrophicum]TGD99746.1 hypothetical protein EU555_11275 [Methylobacterium nonmethylotrophicum]